MYEKRIENLANRKYKTIIEKIWDEDEGDYYFIAYNEEFGKYSCRGEGKTPEEALESLENERFDLIAILLEKGQSVPEPTSTEDELNASGKFLVRTSPFIHQRLLKLAKEMKISFNLLINQLLAQNMTFARMERLIDQRITTAEIKIDRNFQEIKAIQKYEIEDSSLSFEKTEREFGLFRAGEKELKYGIGG
ncbi:MAG: toxin-antitoxin system HicB family antitoxin [Promethearchaeota archaeon]